ncbi:putative cyclase [Trametes meyenii]|nr:putative cyclase [Trametes meyenii]
MAGTLPTYVDLTYVVDENVQVYPGDPAFSCCPTLTIPKDGQTVHSISMGSHTGTHVDAPYHFIQDGATIDTISLSSFVAHAVVVDVTGKQPKELITWTDLLPYIELICRKAALPHGVVVLLHTGWSQHWQSSVYFEHPFLTRDAAERLIALGVKAIGVDTLSPDETCVDGSTPDFGVHHVVLGAGALIVENLTNIASIASGDWLVNFVPLKLKGLDGSPVRAFASRASEHLPANAVSV